MHAEQDEEMTGSDDTRQFSLDYDFPPPRLCTTEKAQGEAQESYIYNLLRLHDSSLHIHSAHDANTTETKTTSFQPCTLGSWVVVSDYGTSDTITKHGWTMTNSNNNIRLIIIKLIDSAHH